MSLAFKRIKIYAQLLLLVVIVGAALLVFYKNWNHTVNFWFFGLTDVDRPINVLWLLIWTAAIAVVAAKLAWLARGLVRNLREVNRMEQTKIAAKEQARRDADFAERERRIDEKLRAAEQQDNSDGE